jgi:hypothetical protein
MNRLALSRAAAGLFRALSARADHPRDRILLINWISVDWQSLTLSGERHSIALRLTGDGAEESSHRMCDGLEDADFAIPAQIVADIAVVSPPLVDPADGSVIVAIEALTVFE